MGSAATKASAENGRYSRTFTQTDRLALQREPFHRLLDGADPRAHQHDDAFGLRVHRRSRRAGMGAR